MRVYFNGCWEECKWICNIAFDDVFSAFDLLRNVKCLLSHYSLLMKAVSGGFFHHFSWIKLSLKCLSLKVCKGIIKLSPGLRQDNTETNRDRVLPGMFNYK